MEEITYRKKLSSILKSMNASALHSSLFGKLLIGVPSRIVTPPVSSSTALSGLRFDSCSEFTPHYHSAFDVPCSVFNICYCTPSEETVYINYDPYLSGIEDFLDRDDPEEDRFFYHPDHLGSSSFITDASGAACEHLQYMPFGETFVSQKASWWNTPYQFSGKEKDEETGFNYFGARYYNSDVSVWLSVDPLSDKYPSSSPYLYVENNPVKFIDPNGMFKDWFVNSKTGELIHDETKFKGDEKLLGADWKHVATESEIVPSTYKSTPVNKKVDKHPNAKLYSLENSKKITEANDRILAPQKAVSDIRQTLYVSGGPAGPGNTYSTSAIVSVGDEVWMDVTYVNKNYSFRSSSFKHYEYPEDGMPGSVSTTNYSYYRPGFWERLFGLYVSATYRFSLNQTYNLNQIKVHLGPATYKGTRLLTHLK